jgi:hypothetical protein
MPSLSQMRKDLQSLTGKKQRTTKFGAPEQHEFNERTTPHTPNARAIRRTPFRNSGNLPDVNREQINNAINQHFSDYGKLLLFTGGVALNKVVFRKLLSVSLKPLAKKMHLVYKKFINCGFKIPQNYNLSLRGTVNTYFASVLSNIDILEQEINKINQINKIKKYSFGVTTGQYAKGAYIGLTALEIGLIVNNRKTIKLYTLKLEKMNQQLDEICKKIK